ncbi:MAG: MBL fold metallo-hydrolase [Desulfohalobiaceae bacterium]|nr:MBL fold metallo-hydrolase [Desulfohalobiaceae bacterium]
MGQTRITVLCENTAVGIFGLLGEHGFSALVEKDGRSLLFDTGQGHTLAHNMRYLGLGGRTVDGIALSHGHYDHVGGLADALIQNGGARITAHPAVLGAKYTRRKTAAGQKDTYIGMPHDRAFLEDTLGASFQFVSECRQILPGMYFSGEVPRVTDFESSDPGMMVHTESGMEQDPLADDASLLLETESGPVVLLGCAHAGTVNVLRHFREQTGHTRFHAIIGGTHLGFLNDEKQLEQTMLALEDYGLELVAVSHCTGQYAAAAFLRRFGSRFAFAGAGWSAVF